MNTKAMRAVVTLASLAGAAGSCGNLSDPTTTASMHKAASAVSVRYASDGTLVVYDSSAIEAWTIVPLTETKIHVSLSSGDTAAFSLSDDGRIAAVGAAAESGGAQTLVQLVDLSSGKETSVIHLVEPPGGPARSVLGLTLSPAADLVFVVEGFGGGVSGGQPVAGAMFDTASGAQLWTIDATGPEVEAFFSSDASTLYTLGTSQHQGGFQKLDSRTGAVGLDAPVADVLQNFGGMSDPNTLIGVAVCEYGVPGSECTAIELFSTGDGSLTRQVPLAPNTEFGGGMIQPPAFRCAVAAGVCVLPVALETDPNASALTQAIQIWSLDGTLVQSLDVPVGDAAISPDGQYVAVIVMGDVGVYRVSDGRLVALLPFRNRTL